MAVWRRKPKDKVLIQSDQGSQFTSLDCASFLTHHNLVHSMSRRGNAMTKWWPRASSIF
jgi:putative transposase